MQTHAITRKSAISFQSARRFSFHKLKEIERIYVVYDPSGRCFKGGFGPAFVKPIFNAIVEPLNVTDRDQEIARYVKQIDY